MARKIKVVSAKDPAQLPWKATGRATWSIESTGLFTDAGRRPRATSPPARRKSIITAPAKGDCLTIVMGVNEGKYDRETAPRHFQRLLHDQLPGADRARAAEGRLRHRRRPDDHHPLLHRHAEDGRRPEQEGLEGRPHRGVEPDSFHHRRGQGRRPGAARKSKAS